LNVREIFVLSFIVSEKIEKEMDDALALRIENKTAIQFARKVRTIFTLKIIVGIFVKLFLILVLHLYDNFLS
jgi:hypothetical protein